MAKEVQQFGATTSQLASYKGKNKQIVVNRDNHRIHVMDGSTNGGVPHALKSEVDAAQAKADAALPKSGGEVTGWIRFGSGARIVSAVSNDEGSTAVYGGSGGTAGAYINLFGKNHATNPGMFQLVTNNGTTTKMLRALPDGPLVWDGNNVITSAGGALNSSLQFTNSTAMSRSVTNDRLIAFGGTNADTGAYIRLSGKDESGYNGNCIIRVTDGTNAKNLDIRPNGSVLWDGKEVLNGVSDSGSYYGKLQASNCLVFAGSVIAESTETTVTFPLPFAEYPTLVVQQQDGGPSQDITVTQSDKGVSFKITRTSTNTTRFNYIAVGKKA